MAQAIHIPNHDHSNHTKHQRQRQHWVQQLFLHHQLTSSYVPNIHIPMGYSIHHILPIHILHILPSIHNEHRHRHQDWGGYGGYGLGYGRLGYAGLGYYGKRSADAEPEADAG